MATALRVGVVDVVGEGGGKGGGVCCNCVGKRGLADSGASCNCTVVHPQSVCEGCQRCSRDATTDDSSALTCPDAWRRFQETVGIINGVDVAKFPAVLTRLIKKLHTKVTACSDPCASLARACSEPQPALVQDDAFSEDEKGQLATMFSVSGVSSS